MQSFPITKELRLRRGFNAAVKMMLKVLRKAIRIIQTNLHDTVSTKHIFFFQKRKKNIQTFFDIDKLSPFVSNVTAQGHKK